MKRTLLLLILLTSLISGFQLPAKAQSSDNIGPKTQQYIDNLNEVREAQNNGQPVNNQTPVSQSPSAWKYVLYGALSGAVYAFWRWLKRLRSGD
ncbi:MAG TPA: hypothetical protein VFW77_02735 [Candidatus Saccharimonadales bacterium]|nr:hypothetical protein [Candidatus Saccharimonadales bacterium]